MTAALVMMVACLLWVAGITVDREKTACRRTIEYWWAFSAFFFGGLFTLASLSAAKLNGDQITALKAAPLVLLGIVLTGRTLLRRCAFIPPAGFALAICFGFMFTGEGLLMPLVSLLTFLPALIVPRGGYNFDSLRAGAAGGISLFLAVLALAVLVQPQQFLVGCSGTYKCSIWGAKIGLGALGNSLGIYLAAAAAVTFLAATTWYGFALAFWGSLLCVEITVSRSGLVAWVIAVGVWICYVLAKRIRSRIPVTTASLLVCTTAALIPFRDWRPSDLTFRPVLWWQALRLFEESPLFGYGPSYWARDETGFRSGSNFALTANYSTHNILLEMLISAGLLGAIAFIFALALATASTRFEISSYTIALVGIVIGLSLTEVASAPGRIYLFP